MTSPIDSWDENTSVVFTFGADSFGTWLFFILAVVLFVAYLVRMVQHENHAFAAVVEAATPAPETNGEDVDDAPAEG